jgi:hypothetical protein
MECVMKFHPGTLFFPSFKAIRAALIKTLTFFRHYPRLTPSSSLNDVGERNESQHCKLAHAVTHGQMVSGFCACRRGVKRRKKSAE